MGDGARPDHRGAVTGERAILRHSGEVESSVSDDTSGALLIRLFVGGPVLGALAGMAQTASSSTVWLLHGQPDFYFRGWQGVQVSFAMWAVGGAMAGAAFLLVLLMWEVTLKRAVRLALFVPVVVAVGFLIAFAVTWIEFQRGALITLFGLPMLSELLALAFAAACAPVLARPLSREAHSPI